VPPRQPAEPRYSRPATRRPPPPPRMQGRELRCAV
jgi:hypothetical protein